MKNAFVYDIRWGKMLEGLSLPDNERLVAESIRYTLMEMPEAKREVEKVVSVEDGTVMVNRLELMNMINASLVAAEDLIPEEKMSSDPDVPDAMDMINSMDAYEMVNRVCACADGGAFAEFLGRLYDLICC